MEHLPTSDESVTDGAAAPEEIPEVSQDTPQQPTIEELAAQLGWRPKEKLRDQSKFVDPAEYIRRTGKINHNYAKEINHLKKSVDGIMANFSQAVEQQYQKGIADAEARYKAAKADFDVDAMEQAQAEKQKLVAEYQQKQQNRPQQTLPEVEEFIERNTWFDKEPDMTADALAYKEQYLKANPGAEASAVLKYIERKIKREYPEFFESAETEKPKANTPPAPEGARGGGQQVAAWQKDKKLLNDFEREMMKQTVKSVPGYTEQKYIETLRAQGALDGRN